MSAQHTVAVAQRVRAQQRVDRLHLQVLAVITEYNSAVDRLNNLDPIFEFPHAMLAFDVNEHTFLPD